MLTMTPPNNRVEAMRKTAHLIPCRYVSEVKSHDRERR
jgi:hypothetical protein